MNPDFVARHGSYYDNIRSKENAGRISAPGNQYLVHLLRGGYLGDTWRDGQGRKALDVGCGSGYNAVTLSLLGWKASAVDITPEIVEHAKETAAPYGEPIDFRVGENESLPFDDDEFDLLISVGVIHYCPSAKAIERSVKEYARVLSSGGMLILVTNHPDNWILKGAESQGGDMVLVRQTGDYRDKQRLFLFRDLDHLTTTFEPYFCNIRTGVNRTEFFRRTLVHQVMAAEKRKA